MKASRQGFVLARRWNYLSIRSFYQAAASTANIDSALSATQRQPYKNCPPNVLLKQQQQQQHQQQSFQNKYTTKRWQSTCPLPACDVEDDALGPVGDLFGFPEDEVGWNEKIVGKTGSIRRSFGPQSNAEAMITCGGEPLAAHASFDPNYGRAQEWIRSHPVGPAVLSPILISGLVGSLVEAAFPKAVAVKSSMDYLRPLIVGVEVRAKIEVVSVCKSGSSGGDNNCEGGKAAATTTTNEQKDVRERQNGHQVNLRTSVFRITDETMIAEGTHSIWIPDYLHM